MRILAFDPGYGRLGWGAIENLEFLDCGLIETELKKSMSSRLAELQEKIQKCIYKIQPKMIVMERLYFHKNKKTIAGVYQAQGIILASAGSLNYEVKEINPSSIKRIITGSGKANKEDIVKMLHHIVKQKIQFKQDDTSDALACAIAGHFLIHSEQKLKNNLK